jgi:hypothetical protein
MKDAPIIVLDEACSALDTEAELEIQRALGAVTPLAGHRPPRSSTGSSFFAKAGWSSRIRRPNCVGGAASSTGCAARKSEDPMRLAS